MSDLSKYFPIQSIEDGFLIRGDGAFTAGYNLTQMPEIYSFSTAEMNKVHEGLSKVIYGLDKNIVLTKHDYFYEDKYSPGGMTINNTIHQNNISYYQDRPILKHFSNIFITFLTNPKIDKDPFKSNLFGGADWISKKPFKLLEEQKEKSYYILEKFIANINSIIGLKAKRMDNNQLGCSLVDFYNFSFESPCQNYKETTLQPFLNLKDCIKIGDKYISINTLRSEGEACFSCAKNDTADGAVYANGIKYNNDIDLRASFVFPLGLGLPIKHILSTQIEIYDNQDIISHATGMKIKLNPGRFLKIKSIKEKIENGIDVYIETLKGTEQACIMSLSVITAHEDKKELGRLNSLIHGAFQRMRKATAWTENKDSAAIFWSEIPGAANNNYRSKLTTIDSAICYLHKETMYKSDPHGELFVDLYGTPFILDTWGKDGIVNRNAVFIGPTRSGKSFTANHFVTGWFSKGDYIRIIDKEHSYKRNNQLLGGKYFDSGDKKNFRFNIFLCPTNKNGKYIYKGGEKEEKDQLLRVITALTIIWKNLNTDEENILYDAIEKYYEYINEKNIFPSFNTFYDYTDYYTKHIISESLLHRIDFESLKLALKRFVKGGEYEYLVNAEDIIDTVKDRFVVYDVVDIAAGDPKIYNLFTFLIVDDIATMLKKLKGIRKRIIWDEAFDILKSPVMGPYVGYLFRTIAKYEGQIIIIAQNIQFIEDLPHEIKSSIKINCGIKVFLTHKDNQDSIPVMVGGGWITPDDAEKMKIVKFGQAFIKTGSSSRIASVELSDYAKYAYSSWQHEVVEMNKLADKYMGNMDVGINEYIKQKKEIQQ